MYLLIVIFSITVWRYILFGSFYVHGFEVFTDTWLHSCTSRVLLMACVWVYNKMITQKNFAMSKFFSLAGVNVELYSTYFWPTAFMEIGVKLLSHE